MNACTDFFELVVSGHILVAVMDFLGMSSIEDTPSSTLISPNIWMLSDEERSSALMGVAAQVVDKHVNLST